MSRLFLRACAVLVVAAHSWLASAQSATSTAPPPSRVPPAPPQLVVARPAEAPVRLQSVKIDSEVSGGQALTAVEMVFFNPNSRVLEGELQFPLLDGQQVVGFALDIDGRLRAAVPVEKARGQQVFEDIARQRTDPGLLSQTAGNNYKIRVYPLPAHGSRRVVIRYSEVLPVQNHERMYRLPLTYAAPLETLSLRLTVRSPENAPAARGALGQLQLDRFGTDYRADIERRHFAAKGWLELALPEPTRPEVRTQVVDGREYFVAEVPAPAAGRTSPRRLPKVVGLLWDSSGSAGSREQSREFGLLDAYFARLGDGEVRLIRLRDKGEAVERFAVRHGDWRELRKALEATAYDGATQLAAFTPEAGIGEYLLFSDGLDNYGDLPFPRTGAPVHAISASVSANAVRLQHISRQSGGRFIDLLASPAAEAHHLLLDEVHWLDDVSGSAVSNLVVASPLPTTGRWLVAGRIEGSDGRLKLSVYRNGQRRTIELPIRPGEGSDKLAAATWARLKVATLAGESRLHRNEIREIGRKFGLVTQETSLIVLDTPQDYARYDIEAPAELKAEVDRLRATTARNAANEQKAHLEQTVARFEEKKRWWEMDFPKGNRPAPPKTPPSIAAGAAALESAPSPLASRFAPSPAAAPAMAEPRADTAAKSSSPEGGGGIAIRLQPARSDAAYVARLRQAVPADLYAVYLDERRANTSSTAFFLDAADIFFERGQRDLGLRALSNLAEMDLENRHILRILGYRLLQADAPLLAIPILQRVLELAPNEPQSWRDLGLAYQAAGKGQEAFDHLLEVIMRPWHGRFPDIELTALAELNALVATSATPIDSARLDPRLARNLPLDLRAVLSWDADNTDIDLWVTDPNGEKCYYGNRGTYQGGRMSADFTGGYGPEEFSLKTAKPGKYKVEANFFGHRQQIVAGATTLQVRLASHFGTAKAEEKIVTLRLKGQNEVVQVGEFELR